MSSGFILSSFPAPPTHVPIPPPRYLSTTFLVGGGLDTGAGDANGGGLANGNAGNAEGSAGVAHSHLPSHSPPLISLPLRSRSSSSASSMASFPATSLTVPFPVSSASSHLGMVVPPSSGPPPTVPLPPLPSQPSPISPERQIAFAYARSLRSATSSESLRSVGSAHSQSHKMQHPGSMIKRLDSSQSIQSLLSGGSVPSLAAPLVNNSDSDNSTTGTESSGTLPGTLSSCTTPTQRPERYAESPSSLRDYEESILDIELDFDSGSSDGDDGDQSSVSNGGIRAKSNGKDNERGVAFPLSSNQTPLPIATGSSLNPTSSSFISTSADSTRPRLGSPPTPVQSRNRSRSGTLTSVSSNSGLKGYSQTQVNEKGLRTLYLVDSRSNNQKYNNTNFGSSTSRIRTYSQPSTSGFSGIAQKPYPHSHSQSHPAPYSARARAMSSVNTPPRTRNIPSYSLVSPSPSTSRSSSVSNSSTAKHLQNRYPAIAMSAPSSPPASVSLPPPIDITRDHDPPPTTPLTSIHKHSSSPNPSSYGNDTLEDDDDRSTSPDLQTLLSHTSEVLKSGGKVRSSSRPSSRSRSRSRPRLKSEDRIRTISTVSAGSKRSVGSGSVGSGKSAAIIPLPTPSRSQTHLHTFGSSRQKSRPRLRSDSKSSLVSKSSTDRMTNHSTGASSGFGFYTNATAGPSSRASLMDESFDDDRDVFRDDDDDTERDREDDAFSFFNPSSSSRAHRQLSNAEDDPTLTLSFPVMDDDDGENIIDLKTPLPHLLLRAGVLSPHSKLLPRKVDSSDEEDNAKGRGRASPVDSLISSTTASSKHPRDARDTVKRRVRHKDGKLLRGGIGLTTGLGWSDSEDEDAPSDFTTRLKRLASMGGLSALSRKSSMASNMSSYTGSLSTTTSNLSGYGNVYGSGGGSFGINGHGYTPSISVSQSGSGGRLSTYTTYSTTDNASVSKRGSMFSEVSVSTGYNGRYVNGSGGANASGTTTPSVSLSASSSRNVSRQSSLSNISYHQSLSPHHNRKDSEIIEEDENYSVAASSKEKERPRKTASMVHVDDRTEKATATTVSLTSSPARSRSPLRRERNSTISVSSTSSAHSVRSTRSTQSTQSNSLSLNPPSIAGSATPTPETPTTPTPMSSFTVHEPSPSHANASTQSPAFVHPVPGRQPIRLNTSHLGIAARSHSPVPPPSPAPTGPLPPTPGDSLIKGKVGSTTGGIGVPATATPGTSKSSPTPSSGLNYDSPSDTIPAATPPPPPPPPPPPLLSPLESQPPQTTSSNLTSSSLQSTSQIPSPPPPAMSSANPARVTSPTPSFSMPTGSRTIHPPRSRTGSISSSRDSSFSVSASMKSKGGSIGSIGSIGSLGALGGGEEKERGRLPFVIEDDGTEKDEMGTSGGDESGSASIIAIATTSQALSPPIDPDAIAIIEMEPSEYGDDVAVALTGDEESTTDTARSESIAFSPRVPMRGESKASAVNVDIDTQSIPEYPYRFEMPPPSPVISAKGGSTGSFGFKRNDRPRVLQQNSNTSISSPSPSSGLAKYSVTSPPSVAFSPKPAPASRPQQHEHNASVSSLETSESTASFLGGGRSDHMRMESWNQNFSVFGSGMGVPPPDDVSSVHTKPAATSRLPSVAKPPMSRNNTYHTTTAPTPVNAIPPSSSSAPSAVSSLLSRAASPILARARAASPISSISSMRVGSSLGFASSSSSSSIPLSSLSGSTPNGPSTRRPTTPSSQLGLTSFSQRARGPSPVPSSTSNAANTVSKLPSAAPHQHPPITPAPRKSSLPLPPSLFTSPGRPTSPPPPPPSAAGHMPSLLLRPGSSTGTGTGAGSIPRKVGGIPRPSPSPSPAPISTSTSTSSKPVPASTPSPLPASNKIAPTSMTSSSIPSIRSSSGTPHSVTMLPQPGSGRRVGTPVSRYGTPGVGSGVGKRG